MSNNDYLERLLVALDECGIKKYGRNPQVADKTGYATGMVAKILSGNAALTDRFIQAACNGFGIRKEWVLEGEKPIRQPFDIAELEGWEMPPEWHQNRLNRLHKDRELLEIEIVKLNAIKTDIEASFERYKDLIIEFNRIPVNEMDRAIDVLRIVQTLKNEST